jgi:hypothetical protein
MCKYKPGQHESAEPALPVICDAYSEPPYEGGEVPPHCIVPIFPELGALSEEVARTFVEEDADRGL